MIFYEHRTSMGLHRTSRLDCLPHLHRHIELVYIAEGTCRIQIDQTEYIVSAGQVAITFPLQIHSYSESNNLDTFLFLCDPDEFPDLEDYFSTKRPVCPIIDMDKDLMKTLFEKALTTYRGESKFKTEIAKGYLQVILSETLEKLNMINHEPTDMNIVERILEYCDNEYMNPISLETLSKKVGASKYYISRIFSTKIKMSFNDYINTLRVNASKRFLKHTKDSIEIISAEVGFSTVRSYNREFKRLVGISPSQYRKNKSK